MFSFMAFKIKTFATCSNFLIFNAYFYCPQSSESTPLLANMASNEAMEGQKLNQYLGALAGKY